jgi:hypothetical protein
VNQTTQADFAMRGVIARLNAAIEAEANLHQLDPWKFRLKIARHFHRIPLRDLCKLLNITVPHGKETA